MKILITGSSGFVGSHLTKLLSKEHEIVKYDLVDGQNVLDEKLLAEKLQGVSLVIHLAAFISAIESWEKPREYMENNAIGTLCVTRNSIKAGVQKIIFFSSAAVKAKPLTPYAVSKIAAEKILDLYKDKINTIVVRPENIYGLGQKASYGYVIHNFIKASKNGTSIKIYGDGNQTRDFIYIEDVVRVVRTIVDMNVLSGTIISLGTGKAIKISDLAKEVIKIVGDKTNIEYLEKRDEPQNSSADISTMTKLNIDPENFLTIDAGIRKLVSLL